MTPNQPRAGDASKQAFTLIELLVLIVVIAILAALTIPVNKGARDRARTTACVSNLRQISIGIHMYLDDQNNSSPGNTNAARSPFMSFTDYRELINDYVGLKGKPSPGDRVFSCPADKFFYDMSRNGRGYVPQPLYEQTNHAFTSYSYNAGEASNATATNDLGIAGQRLETVRNPGRTVLIAETPAFSPYSWHSPKKPFSRENATFTDARDILAFVDGHVRYVKMFYDGKQIAWKLKPPAGYDYQWKDD